MRFVILLVFAGILHKRSWGRLQVESCTLHERGLTSGTWANKVCHLRSYISFTVYYGVQDFPVQLGVLLRFITLLGRGPITYDYATNIIGSLRWFAALLDPPSVQTFDAVLVKVSMKGLKAQLSRPVRQKLPFSVEHLLKFYNILDLSDTKQLAGWCAMLVAFFGCFRLSNLVPLSQGTFDPLKQLKRNDIKFEKNLALIYYKWSKTNQNSSKVAWVPIGKVADERFNINKFFKILFANVKVDSDAPLFSFNNKQHHSRYTLTKLLDKCVFEAGLSLSDYSWHSFRRRAAVFAFELGLADSAVQLLGDWSSSAFKNYLEFAFLKKVSVAETIAQSFDYHLNNM